LALSATGTTLAVGTWLADDQYYGGTANITVFLYSHDQWVHAQVGILEVLETAASVGPRTPLPFTTPP
jgi:hypothetical protein